MKKKIKIIIIVFLLLMSFSVTTIKAKKLPLFGIVITIDPGHGGVGLIQKLMVLL